MLISHRFGRLSMRTFCYSVLLSILFLGCHSTWHERALAPASERLVAEAQIFPHGNGDEHVFLPVTIRGHVVTLILDLGSGLGIIDGQWLASVQSVPSGANGFGTGLVDSITLGTATEQHVMVMTMPFKHPVPGLPPVVGLLGMDVLSHYDLLFDGVTHRVRLYTPSSVSQTATSQQAAWLPPGLTPADCTPLHNTKDGLIALDLTFNGHQLSGFFDSGAKGNAIDNTAAQSLGITQQSPHVHFLQGAVMQGVGGTSKNRTYLWDSVDVAVGHVHLPLQEIKINLDGSGVALGLDAFRDRLLWVSNSTKQVCISSGRQ